SSVPISIRSLLPSGLKRKYIGKRSAILNEVTIRSSSVSQIVTLGSSGPFTSRKAIRFPLESTAPTEAKKGPPYDVWVASSRPLSTSKTLQYMGSDKSRQPQNKSRFPLELKDKCTQWSSPTENRRNSLQDRGSRILIVRSSPPAADRRWLSGLKA